MSREEWSEKIRDCADAIYTGMPTDAASAIDATIDAIMSIQAAVERPRKRKEDDDYTVTVECGGKSLRVIAGKAIIDRARSPEKLADSYVKSVVGEMLEGVFRIKQINDENHAMRVALLHLAEPGNMAARTLAAIEKARQPNV
jgi:metal-dependent amidase/aminoacylase/carboxypeptidase family protein